MNSLDVQPELVTDLLVRFLREEVRTAGFERALVGLSGGIDSALTCALSCRAFGPENVLAVMMPTSVSNPDSEGDARRVISALGCASRRVDITAMAEGYLGQEGVQAAMRRGNVYARCRMIVLYDLSVEWSGLVIGTSNKTEMLLGYSTQWGDSASAVNPLGDLYKHQIVQLAHYLELPEEVIEKPPSADLFEGQTDEGELGFTYQEADQLLYRLVDLRESEARLAEDGIDRDLIREVVRRVAQNQYKRLPPVLCKLSQRTINHDFRYLRDWGK